VRDYVTVRFPRLPRDSHELAVAIYLSDKNLSTIAMSTGVEFAVIPFSGIPRIDMPTLEAYCNSSAEKSSDAGKEPPQISSVRQTEVYAAIFKAVLGVIFSERVCNRPWIRKLMINYVRVRFRQEISSMVCYSRERSTKTFSVAPVTRCSSWAMRCKSLACLSLIIVCYMKLVV